MNLSNTTVSSPIRLYLMILVPFSLAALVVFRLQTQPYYNQCNSVSVDKQETTTAPVEQTTVPRPIRPDPPILYPAPNPLCPPANATDAASFRDRSTLFAIVTGCERSGTTIASALIMSNPHLFGGFEGGFLLASTPKQFRVGHYYPFPEWSMRPLSMRGWGLDKTTLGILQQSHCFAELYFRLRQLSPLYSWPHTTHSWIVDKTPRYIYELDTILAKAPDVPVIVTIKSRDDLIASWTSRNQTVQGAQGAYSKAMVALRRAQERFPDRIWVVNHTLFQQQPDVEMQKVFDFLHLDWDPAYKTMEAFNAKSKPLGMPMEPAFYG